MKNQLSITEKQSIVSAIASAIENSLIIFDINISKNGIKFNTKESILIPTLQVEIKQIFERNQTNTVDYLFTIKAEVKINYLSRSTIKDFYTNKYSKIIAKKLLEKCQTNDITSEKYINCIERQNAALYWRQLMKKINSNPEEISFLLFISVDINKSVYSSIKRREKESPDVLFKEIVEKYPDIVMPELGLLLPGFGTVLIESLKMYFGGFITNMVANALKGLQEINNEDKK